MLLRLWNNSEVSKVCVGGGGLSSKIYVFRVLGKSKLKFSDVFTLRCFIGIEGCKIVLQWLFSAGCVFHFCENGEGLYESKQLSLI